jgi:aquaporin Z
MPPKKTTTKATSVKKKAVAKKTTTSVQKSSYNLLDKGPKMNFPHFKKEVQQYLSEFLGVGMLVFAVTLNIAYGSLVLSTPLVAALVVGFFVYTVGGISGAHLNPAVTTALFLNRNISYKTAIFYILAQVTGAIAAIGLYVACNLSIPELYAVDTNHMFVLEAIGTFILAFGVLNVANKKVTQGASGLVVGGSLLTGIAIAGNYTLGILNPAVALGWGIFSLTYLVAPLVGGVVAAIVYKVLNAK